MGKKKAGKVAEVLKPFCFFCEREFEDERVLIQHQCTKHFRCTECVSNPGVTFSHGKRSAMGQCDSLHGLMCHMVKVHNKELKNVPNAMQGRDDPGQNVSIHGMSFIPEEVMQERYRKCGIAPPEKVPLPEGPPPVSHVSMDMPPMLPPEPGTASDEQPAAPEQNLSDAPAGGSMDWAQEVQAFLARKAQEEQEEVQQERGWDVPEDAQMGSFSADTSNYGYAPLDSGNAASWDRNQPWDRNPQPWRGPLETRPEVAAAFPPPRSRSRSGSPGRRKMPNRGRRSRSGWRPGRSRSRSGKPAWGSGGGTQAWRRSASRDANPTRGRNSGWNRGDNPRPKLDSTQMRTIHITGGLSEQTTRLWLKKQMEKFGRVEICHTGNRHSPTAELPWVRFAGQTSADAAMEAVKAGTLIIDGTMIQAEVGMGERRAQRPPRDQIMLQRSERDLQLTSRDLAQDDHRRSRRQRWG